MGTGWDVCMTWNTSILISFKSCSVAIELLQGMSVFWKMLIFFPAKNYGKVGPGKAAQGLKAVVGCTPRLSPLGESDKSYATGTFLRYFPLQIDFY